MFCILYYNYHHQVDPPSDPTLRYLTSLAAETLKIFLTGNPGGAAQRITTVAGTLNAITTTDSVDELKKVLS